jgi:hypothetical protein
MAQFTLNWDNTALLAEPNVIAQRALYRRKSTAGTFISAGFTPVNDLPVSATTTASPVLLDNVIYEFKIQTLCTVNGPTTNNNGVIEQIKFTCITPEIVSDATTTQINVICTDLDITKIRFTLRRLSDDVIVYGPVLALPAAGNVYSAIATGLVASTDYYWQYEMYSTINGVEVISSSVSYLNAVCGDYPISTTAVSSCTAPEDLEVTNVV